MNNLCRVMLLFVCICGVTEAGVGSVVPNSCNNHVLATFFCLNSAPTNKLSETKQLCEHYVKRFLAPETNLLYSKPLDTPSGYALLANTNFVAAEMVAGKYMPYGYGSGIQDTAYHSGTFLYALCEAYEATGDSYFSELAKQIFSGLKLLGSISDVTGFVPRGPHPLNKLSYYKDSSVDQHAMYFSGLWRYFHSSIASIEDKEFISRKINDFAARMVDNGWHLNVEDNSREAHASGGDWYWRYWSLLTLGMAADITQSSYWQGQYTSFSNENGQRRWSDIGYQSPDLPKYLLYHAQNAFNWSVLSSIETNSVLSSVPISKMNLIGQDMLSCNFLSHYYRRDWIGQETLDNDVDLVLQNIGYHSSSIFTIYDVWEKYDSNLTTIKLSTGRTVNYKNLWMYALMSSQIGLLSNDRYLYDKADLITDDILTKINFSNEDNAWLFNYATITALLNLARQQPAQPVSWSNRWQIDEGYWSDPENWDKGRVPDFNDMQLSSGQVAQIPGGKAVVVNSGTSVSAYKLQVGTTVYSGNPVVVNVEAEASLSCSGYILLANEPDTSAEFNQFGGNVETHSYLTVGGRGSGVYNMHDGTLTVAGTLSIPSTDRGAGKFNLNGGAVNVGSSGTGVNIGSNGVLNVNSGHMDVDARLRIWAEGGQVNIEHGSISMRSLDLTFGQVKISDGGEMKILGDVTAQIKSYIAQKRIITTSVEYDVVCIYDNGKTVIFLNDNQ